MKDQLRNEVKEETGTWRNIDGIGHRCSWWETVKELISFENVYGAYCDCLRWGMTTEMEHRKYSNTYAWNDPMDTLPAFQDDRKSLASYCNSGDEEVSFGKLSKRRSGRHHSKRSKKDLNRLFSSYKSSKQKYDTCSETEVGNDK